MTIAGYGIFMKERYKEVELSASAKAKPTELVPALRYVERSTGNVYQTFSDKISEEKFSMTIIPQVYEAYFGAKGETVIMRHLKTDDETIETFAGSIPKELLGSQATGTNEIKGSFLPENITDLIVSPDGSKIFYLLNSGENANGIVSNILGDKKVQIFSSPFTEWLSYWPNSNTITLTTKSSSGIPGYMYAIDPNKKDLVKIFGDIGGLTTLTSPNDKLVLYGDSNLSLGIYNTETRNSTPLRVTTRPDKCVWALTSDPL